MTDTTHFLDPKAAEISRRVSNIFPDRKGTETLVFLWGEPSIANPAMVIARVTRESDEDRITYIMLEGKVFKSEVIPPEEPKPEKKDRNRFAKGLGFKNIDELRKAHGIAVKESFIKKFFKKLWSFLPNG